jgi:hypothetical protein
MRIGDDKQVTAHDRVAAEGDVPRGFLHFHPYPGLKPLAILVDDGDGRNGAVANLRGEVRYLIECLFGKGVQDVVKPKDLKALCFIFGYGCGQHENDDFSIYVVILNEPKKENLACYAKIFRRVSRNVCSATSARFQNPEA